MGAVQNVVGRIRDAFRQDKARGGDLLAKGSTSPTFAETGYDLLQAYGYDALSDYLRLEHDLLSRYVDYEEMDDYPEISSAIDIYADDASQPDTQLRRSMWAVSPDKTVETMMNDLYHRQLRMDEEIWEIARSTCKYGNDYEEMLINDNGVVGLNFLPAPTVRRIEGPRGELYGFVQDFRGRFGHSPQEFQRMLAQRTDAVRRMYQPGGGVDKSAGKNSVTALEDWEVVHFRLRGKTRRAVYGYCLAGDSRVWTPDGLKEIRDIRAGDRVFTRHAGRLLTTKVLDQICSGTKPVYRLKTAHREVHLTAEHPVLVEEGGQDKWVPAGEVRIGDRVVVAGGELQQAIFGKLKESEEFAFEELVSFELMGEELVYDIEVENSEHNFIADGVVVHNSVLESARWIWKRLLLLEDAAMIYRLQRAPERFAFYVDVGDLPPAEALAYVNRVRQQHKKKKFVNPSTNKLDLKWEPLPVAHDTPIPLRDGRIITIKEMAEEHAQGKKHEVYSVDRASGEVISGEVSWVGLTRSAGEALGVLFDDGGAAIMAPDHPVLLGTGEYREASDLVHGDRVKSLHRKVNARVISVEVVPPCDHFCMTVEKWHNFALLLRDEDGGITERSGIFVKNSQDDDFFVPSRKGQDGTRIEVLGSPSWQHMDDVEYFRSKLFTAIKVPKAYMNQDESSGRASLSTQDVRFARSVIRVQREIRNGCHKIGRTHLAALGIDPQRASFDVQMTVPSAIFELAQIEVRNARADLASRMKEHVSLHWVLSNVYGLSDEDIQVVVKERVEDTLRDGQAAAEVEKMAAIAQAQATPSGGGGEQLASDNRNAQSIAMLERRIRQLPKHQRGGISERELLQGDREAEKRAEDKLNRLMQVGDQTLKRVQEIGGLVRDVASSGKRSA